jgi:hypothetical protein
MKTPRCRDSGVSLGKLFLILKSPLAPLFQSGVKETPQQRLWGIEKLSTNSTQDLCDQFSVIGGRYTGNLLKLFDETACIIKSTV